MPNTAVRATAEGMPTLNRRRLLLGLAAASTAAATVGTVGTVGAKAIENPDLIALSEQLPAEVEAFLTVKRAYKEWSAEIYRATPWAPDELTVPGTAWPHDGAQPGEPEMKALGGYLWRAGDDFPRRIVVTSYSVRVQLWRARKILRKARKVGPVSDCLFAEDEIKRLTSLLATAETYERDFAAIRATARAEHDRHSSFEAQTKLEQFIASIMETPDWTVEGLVIKAQALAEWDSACADVGHRMSKVAFQHGSDWYGQIAASILRHARGGAE